MAYSTDFLDNNPSPFDDPISSTPATPAITPLPSILTRFTTPASTPTSSFDALNPSMFDPLSSGTGAPIVQSLPRALSAVENKYSDPAYIEFIKSLPKEVRQASVRMDIERAKRGQMPVPQMDAAKAALSAQTRDATTPSPTRRSVSPTAIPGNAVQDLKTIVGSLPHIPGMLVNELKATAQGKFGEEYKQGIKEGLNPITALSRLPIIRLVPGAYTVGNVAGGNWREVLEHPLFTGLDVLPYASKVAKGSKVFKAADQEALSAIEAGREVRRPRPLATVALKKIDRGPGSELFAEPLIVPTKMGEFINDKVKPLAPVQKVSELMSRDTRALSRLRSSTLNEYQNLAAGTTLLDPKAPISAIAERVRKFGRLSGDEAALSEAYGLTPERVIELGEIGSLTPKKISELAPNEQQFLVDYRLTSNEFGEYAARNNMGLSKYGNEFFPDHVVAKLTRAEERMNNAYARVAGGERVLKAGPRAGTRETVKGKMGLWQRVAAIDGKFAEALGQWEAGNISEASKILNHRWNLPDRPPLPRDITDKHVIGLINDVKKARASRQSFEALRATNAPARFHELITHRAAQRYLRQLAQRADSEGLFFDMAEAQRWLKDGIIEKIPGWDEREWLKHRSQNMRLWQKLSAAGEDPIYIPRVSASQAERIYSGRFTDRIPILRSAQDRTADFAAGVRSPTIALTHQGSEILLRHLAEGYLDDVMTGFGVSEPELLARYLPEATRLAEIDPKLSIRGHQLHLMQRDFIAFDPETMGIFGASPLNTGHGRMYLPRSVARTMEAFNKESATSIQRLVDPVTGVMRIALLPLTPRWHFYNIVGGAVMLAAEEGLGAFRPSNIRNALAVMKAAKAGEAIPHAVAKDLINQLGYTTVEEMRLAFGHGKLARRIWEETQAGRLAKGLIKKSYDFNQFFDDAYRTMGYLNKYDKSLMKGLTHKQAQYEGLITANKVMQDSLSLSPFERGVLRSVFPFYTWLSHVMRYAMAYPVDHPLRAAIVGGFGRQVMEDMGDGATQQMLDFITWGGPDAHGNKKGLRVTAMNPFHDAGDMFTLAGWLGSMNPLASTLAEQFGLDLSQGGPELFPDVHYDPETGALTNVPKDPIRGLLFNTIPQVQTLARVAGLDSEFNEMKTTNPGAARSMMVSGAGLPVLNRAINPEERYMKAELKRQEARKDMLGRMIKRGDIDGLRREGVSDNAIQTLLAMQGSGQFDPQLVGAGG